MCTIVRIPNPHPGGPKEYVRYYRFQVKSAWVFMLNYDQDPFKNTPRMVVIDGIREHDAVTATGLAIRYSSIVLDDTYYDMEEKKLYWRTSNAEEFQILNELADWILDHGSLSYLKLDKWGQKIFTDD